MVLALCLFKMGERDVDVVLSRGHGNHSRLRTVKPPKPGEFQGGTNTCIFYGVISSLVKTDFFCSEVLR